MRSEVWDIQLNFLIVCYKTVIKKTENVHKDKVAEFRFYAELNDFLPPGQRQRTLHYSFSGHPGIKDPIEALGVPHTEVELIIVNGQSVRFDYQLQAADRVAVYPLFRQLAIDPLFKLRVRYSLHPRFVLDTNLGKLARFMRLLGFDSLYRNDYRDSTIARIAASEQRIVLTRDRRLLHNKQIHYGYWVRAVDVESQIDEVVRRFDLCGLIHPFARCLVCNDVLVPVEKKDILDRLEPKTKRFFEIFSRCPTCQRIYWEGSHLENMRRRFTGLLSCQEKLEKGHKSEIENVKQEENDSQQPVSQNT